MICTKLDGVHEGRSILTTESGEPQRVEIRTRTSESRPEVMRAIFAVDNTALPFVSAHVSPDEDPHGYAVEFKLSQNLRRSHVAVPDEIRDGVCLCPRCVGRRRRWSHRFDRHAMRAACEHLGLTRPVKADIALIDGMSAGGQGYCVSPRCNAHHVRVDPDVGAVAANFVVCHELVHCQQAEREPDFLDRYLAANERLGYKNNPYEHEADEVGLALAREFNVAS